MINSGQDQAMVGFKQRILVTELQTQCTQMSLGTQLGHSRFNFKPALHLTQLKITNFGIFFHYFTINSFGYKYHKKFMPEDFVP